MLNKTKLLKFVGIKPEELKNTFFMFLFAFSIGIIHNILSSVPIAMFLSHYKSSFLPYVYVGAGLAMALVGLAFFYLQKITSTFNVLVIPIALFSISLVFFWGVLFVVKSPWIFLALLIWSIMLVFSSASIMMVLTNQLFTLQQSKRLFGLIFVGLATGGILIGLGMDFLIGLIGSHNLILVAALVFSFGLGMQFLIKKHSSKRLRLFNLPQKGKSSEISLESFKDKKYVISVFATTVLIFFIFYGFDFLLNTVVQEHYPEENEIAVFFGLLFASYDFANIAVGLVLFPWILSKFGLNVALLIWPVTLAILLSVAFVANLLPSLAVIIFPLLVATAVFASSVNESITLQSVLLLFQPLRIEQRAWAQLTNETFIGPLATSAVGVILLIIDEYFGFELSIQILLIIGLCIAASAMIFFVIKKGYLKLLVESLTKSVITKPQFSKLDKDSFAVLKDRLASPYPEEVIYVIQAIEKIDQNKFVNVLQETINNASDKVRCFSLQKIEQYRIKSMEDQLKQICTAKENPDILGSALLAFGAVAGSHQLASFKHYLSDSNVEIVGSSIIAFLKYGSKSEKAEVVELLISRAKSPKEEDRLMAAEVLTHVKIPNEIDVIIPLLKDPNLEVRIIASIAAHHKADERVFSALIDNLAVSHTRDSALTSLVALGTPVLEYTIQNFARFSHRIQLELIHLVGFMKDGKSLDFLQQLLPTSKGKAFHLTLQSLKKLSYKVAEKKRQDAIKNFLKTENKKILHLKEMAVSFNNETTKLLHDLLCREIELSQECCFLLLDFIYPGAAISKAHQGLSSGDPDMHSNAVELLLHTLTKKDQKLLLEQLIYAPYKTETESSLSTEKTEEFLMKITSGHAHYYVSGLSAAAIYTMGVLELKNLIEFVRTNEPKEDPLTKEIVAWTLEKLT